MSTHHHQTTTNPKTKKHIITKKTKLLTYSLLSLIAGSLGMTSCAKTESCSLEGTWMQPIPGMSDAEQGFELHADGTASSVNMATLQYESWMQLDLETLVLNGMSLGNQCTLSFSDTLQLVRVTEDSLLLRRGSLTLSYPRRK